MAGNDEINVKIGAQNAGLLSGLKQAEQAVASSSGYIRASLSGITDVVERIKLPFIELAAILAGGAIFRSVVTGTAELGMELEKASQKTGIAVEDLGGLKFAGEQVDVAFETITKSMQKFSLTLQQANEGATTPGTKALAALGISAKDAEGHTKPLDALIGEIADKFKDYKDGADKTALAMNLFGRAGAGMIPLLNQGKAGIEAAKTEATSMGAVMSGPAVAAAVKYHEAMGRVGLAGESLKIALGTALMPALTMVANAMADSAKEGGILHEAILILKDTVELLAVAFVGLVTSIRLVFDVAKFVFEEVADFIVGVMKVVNDVIKHDWAQAAADTKAAGVMMKTDFKSTIDDMVAHATAGGDAIRKTLGLDGDAPKPKPKKDAPHVGGKDDSLKELQKQWELEKQGYELQIALADDNKAKIIEIKQEMLDRVLQLFGDHSKEYLAAATDLEKTANEIAKEGARADVQAARDAAAERKKIFADTKAQWETLLSGIANAIQSSVTGMIQGTLSMGAAIKNLFRSIVAEYISLGIKSLISHIAIEKAKTAATAEGATEREAIDQFAAMNSVALSAMTAIKNIAISAWQGAAAAYASIAAIPIVGPFLAPTVAAGVAVAIGSFAGQIGSAEGGYDVPRGINPLTQLHQRELVLPAELADRVRGMTGGAGSGAVNFHIYANDTKGFTALLTKHGDHIVKVIQGAERNFKFDAA